MRSAPSPVPWARRVRWLVLPEESLPLPEVEASGPAGLEAGGLPRLVPDRVEPGEGGESSVA